MHQKKHYITNYIYSLKKHWDISLLIPSAVLTLYLSLLWTPMDGFLLGHSFGLSEGISSFNRMIGAALLDGININLRIRNMLIYAFLYLFLVEFIVYSLLYFFLKDVDKHSLGYRFFRKLSFAALPMLCLQIISRLSENFSVNFSPIAFTMLITTIFFLVLYRGLRIDIHKFCLYNAFGLMTVWIFTVQQFFPSYLNSDYKKMIFTTLCFLFSYFSLLILYSLMNHHLKNDRTFISLFWAISFLPILYSIVYEGYNILNQYNIYITNKYTIVVIVTLLTFFISYIIYRVGLLANFQYLLKRVCFPVLIFGIAMLSVQPGIQNIASSELFETANAGGDIFGFLQYGELPFINNFNPHMLGEDIAAILYAWCNQLSPTDAVYSGWGNFNFYIPSLYLIFFYLFWQISDSDSAMLITLLFPLNSMMGFFDVYALGILAIIAANNFLRKKNLLSCLLFVLSCLMTCLYRADSGLMAVAAVIVVSIYLLSQHEFKLLLTLWGIGISTLALCLFIFIGLCILNGVYPLTRILQIIDVISSTERWAYSNVDNNYKFSFFFAYLIFPCLTIVVYIYILITRKQKHISVMQLATVSMLTVTYVLNFQRVISRHNLIENIWYLILYTAPLSIAFCFWLICGKNKDHLPLYLSTWILIQILVGFQDITGNSLLQQNVNRQLNSDLYAVYTNKIDRVVYSSEVKEKFEPLKSFFDATLDDNDTYLDFSGNTTLYSLTNRNKPVLINQSPALLSSEYSQIMYIHEVEQSNAVYALLGSYDTGIDSIPYSITHYLLFEYICSQYEPFCVIDNYYIWVKKDLFDEKLSLFSSFVEKNPSLNVKLIDYRSEGTHSFSLKDLPYIWGTYDDTQKTLLSEMIQPVSENNIQIYVKGMEVGHFKVYIDNIPTNITSLKVPIWCSNIGGQDDLIWYDAKYENGFWTVDVDTAQHAGQEGQYEIHVYDCTDASNLIFLDGISIQAGPSVISNKISQIHKYLLGSDFDTSFGNYIQINGTALSDGTATLSMLDRNGEVLTNFSFNVKSGENQHYLIRVSSDYYWYSGLCEYLTLESDVNLDNINVSVLQGDVNQDAFRSCLKNKSCTIGRNM